MFGKSVLFFFGLCLIFDRASALPVLVCPSVAADGEYTGKFVGIISRSEWTATNFLFLADGAQAPTCVEVEETSNAIRARLTYEAFSQNLKVKIIVKGNHDIIGIAYENPQPVETWYVANDK